MCGYKDKVLEVLSELGLGVAAFLSTLLNQLIVLHCRGENTAQQAQFQMLGNLLLRGGSRLRQEHTS